jgi:16S rRNA (uracil1498-N3)-methyltransferase
MIRIFVREPQVAGDKVVLDHDVKKRLVRVMRLKTGDELEVVTTGKRWRCTLETVAGQAAVARIHEELPAVAPGMRLTLGQAVPKGDRFEWLIEKAAEVGISEIVPLITERTIARPPGSDNKLARWNKIADQAAGQSENPFPTVIHPPLPLAEFLRTASAALKLLLHERSGAESLKKLILHPVDSTIIIVGPEGGWTQTEVDVILAAGYRRIHLGPRVLRSETAGLVVAAILQYELGDFRNT